MLRGYPHLQRWEQTDDVYQTALLRLHQALSQVTPESAQHFWPAPHVVAPHATPLSDGGASIMPLPLPPPLHVPLTHVWPLGHACSASHLKCAPL